METKRGRLARRWLAAFAVVAAIATPLTFARAENDDPYDAHDPMRGDIGEDSRDLDTTRSGCEGGNGKACRHLAGMYSDGRGVGVDEERAREYLRRGCESGDEQSCRKMNR